MVKKHTIIISHVPPYGLQDAAFLGEHIGNKDLRTLIDGKQPRLVLCGHVHENPGVTTYGETVVVNCSLAKKSEGALIEITNSNIKATLLT